MNSSFGAGGAVASRTVTSLYHTKSSLAVFSSFTYTYHEVGNRTAVEELDSRVTWTHDNTYQLTAEHRTGTSPFAIKHSYDALGNRLEESLLYRATAELLGSKTWIVGCGVIGGLQHDN